MLLLSAQAVVALTMFNKSAVVTADALTLGYLPLVMKKRNYTLPVHGVFTDNWSTVITILTNKMKY